METWVILLIAIICVIFAYLIGQQIGKKRRDSFWKEEVLNQRQEAISKSRAVLGGQFAEQLAPFLPDFNFNPSECKFIGKPIDFIVFKGLDNKAVEEIVFVEVKSGESKLSPSEKKIKEAVQSKKVSWQEYRVSHDITKGKAEENE